MVYVDRLRAVAGFPCSRACHMTADSLGEMHAFAASIGMRHEWSQKDHYDLGPAKRRAAVRAGAVETGPHEMSYRVRRHGLGRKAGARRGWCFDGQEPRS